MIKVMNKITIASEEAKKQRLRVSIEKKKKILSVWAEKVESLKMDLEFIRHEYNARVGKLLLKDNKLDLEIIYYKNLKSLMDEGLTYDEAIKHEEGKFYQELLEKERDEERINYDEEILESRIKISKEEEKEIKSLWKKLIFKFHPDLVTDKNEKKKREEIMKAINKSYSENDLKSLQEILESSVAQEKETNVLDLKNVLVGIENTILKLKNEFKDLRNSQWFTWKRKKESSKDKDVFNDLENKLLDDIARKIEILNKLRREINPSYAFIEE